MRVVGGDEDVQGSWIGHSFPVSFFFFSLLFSVLFFLPYEGIKVGVLALCASIPFLFLALSFFLLFLLPYESIKVGGFVLLSSWLCIKRMEPLSLDRPAETDVVRFPTSAKVSLSISSGTRTQDLPHGNRTL